MKNRARFLVLLAFALAAAAVSAGAFLPQDIRHETTAINIEVPVRVFKDGAFVDGLAMSDFEVLEDGKPQKIEAFYLVKRRIIERREEAKEFAPRTARHFFLFFEIGDYDARLSEALDYFVRTVLLPGDNLTIVTPMKTYRMKGELFHLVGRDRTYAQVVGLLRRDIQIGYSESRAILAEMTDLARVMASDVRFRGPVAEAALLTFAEPAVGLQVESPYQGVALEEQLARYGSLLERLSNLRVVDENKLLAFAAHLKELEGQKSVFFFYQREFIPKIDPRVVDLLATKYSERPDITQALDTIFGLQRRESSLNVDVVTKPYADASAAVHFLFVTRPAEQFEGMRMEERSEDIFGPFREMARATGGFSESSANIAAAMRAAVEASENYYLLYYTPAGSRADGRFRRLTVRVRNGAYRVSHRLGYIAD
jgi:hypothetical protein